MGTTPRADGTRPRPHTVNSHISSRDPSEHPTVFVPAAPIVLAKKPHHTPPHIPGPPIPKLRWTFRQLVFGQRSVLFIGVMLVRMIWLIIQGVRDGTDLRFAAAGAGIYVMALVIASPARRLRAVAVGVMCGLIWTYALVDPTSLGSPALASWPAVFPIAVLAVIVEIIFTDTIRAHRGRFGGRSGVLAAGLPRPAITLQVVGVVLFMVPVMVMCVSAWLTYGINSEPLPDLVLVSVSLPPLIGMIGYVSYVLRRLRSLHPRAIRA
jgi:hypothetical protein